VPSGTDLLNTEAVVVSDEETCFRRRTQGREGFGSVLCGCQRLMPFRTAFTKEDFPLLSNSEHNKTVTARFWPQLESFLR